MALEQWRRQLDNWGGGRANIHIFVFCIINFFWNRLFLWSVNTNIWIFAPHYRAGGATALERYELALHETLGRIVLIC
jgi:hypothetical protein